MTAEPRLPPLRAEELDHEARELLAGIPLTAQASNIFTTFVRHRGLFRKWMPFGGKLLAGKLPPRDRELLILRTGWHCRSEYEWGQHVLIGRTAGLTGAEIERVKAGPDAPEWSPADAILLRTADELHELSRITDATWAVLAERYDELQLIEVPMVVGHYHMVAYALNTFGVPRDAGVPGFDV